METEVRIRCVSCFKERRPTEYGRSSKYGRAKSCLECRRRIVRDSYHRRKLGLSCLKQSDPPLRSGNIEALNDLLQDLRFDTVNGISFALIPQHFDGGNSTPTLTIGRKVFEYAGARRAITWILVALPGERILLSLDGYPLSKIAELLAERGYALSHDRIDARSLALDMEGVVIPSVRSRVCIRVDVIRRQFVEFSSSPESIATRTGIPTDIIEALASTMGWTSLREKRAKHSKSTANVYLQRLETLSTMKSEAMERSQCA